MSELPRGCTGEKCKANGTYVSAAGAKQYFAEDECFCNCPATGTETQWTKVT